MAGLPVCAFDNLSMVGWPAFSRGMIGNRSSIINPF
jgi:hypothetical protein